MLFAGPTWLLVLGIHLLDWSLGPFAAWRGNAHALHGFYEALGLGVTFGASFLVASLRSDPDVLFTGIGAALGLILGSANIVWWETAFVANDFTAQGAVSTGLHWTFFVLHLRGLLVRRHRGRA